ncbi:VOC family protein [Ornithinibacillus sp. L9]|uniref:VOC family protein n=1 Tax=Ornithinibacillus caprae TaxID=2678566 RepID=A0A6N8FGV8_9BACI|nr:VOC family protein [Ornithinibacillus caprae]MUK88892.1 VOC family protein [Ornithinibacillus caprae]
MEFKDFNAAQIRVARPTDKFDQVISFYEKGVGLPRIGDFEGHRGFTGVIFGLPDSSYQLEITKHVDGSPCPAPTKDNLLVFYIPSKEELDHVAKRLSLMGYFEVEPENHYWKEKGITIEDPDGWRIVLMNTNGI